MTDVAIRVENFSQRYVIGQLKREGMKTTRQ